MQVVEAEGWDILLCITDGQIATYPLETLVRRQILSKTRYCSCYALSTELERLVVAVKRQLFVFRWQPEAGGLFVELQELSLQSSPKTLLWADDSVCVGSKREYQFYDLNTDVNGLHPRPLAETGRRERPVACALPEQAQTGSGEVCTVTARANRRLHPQPCTLHAVRCTPVTSVPPATLTPYLFLSPPHLLPLPPPSPPPPSQRCSW